MDASCTQLTQKYSQLTAAQQNLRDSLHSFISTPTASVSRTFAQSQQTLVENFAEYTDDFKKNVHDLLATWYPEHHTEFRKQAFLSNGYKVENDGRVILTERLDLRSYDVSYFPSLIKEAQNLSLPEYCYNLEGLEKVEFLLTKTREAFSAPRLKFAASIAADLVREIKLPRLEKNEMSIMAHNCSTFDAGNLRYVGGDFIMPDAHKVTVGKLEHVSGTVSVQSAQELITPLLTKAENIWAESAKTIDLQSLKTCREIVVNTASEVDLPALQDATVICAKNADRVTIPLVDYLSQIHAPLATTIEANNCEFIAERLVITNLTTSLRAAFKKLRFIGNKSIGSVAKFPERLRAEVEQEIHKDRLKISCPYLFE